MKKFSNVEAELQKSFAYWKKRVVESDELHLYLLSDGTQIDK